MRVCRQQLRAVGSCTSCTLSYDIPVLPKNTWLGFFFLFCLLSVLKDQTHSTFFYTIEIDTHFSHNEARFSKVIFSKPCQIVRCD